jgi:PadR family transcriptional regulator, regulatory protein PadR
MYHRCVPGEPMTLPPKERLILELLATGGSAYGLRLVEESRGALRRGTVYVTLARLEAKGLVESEQEPRPPDAIGLPRRLYRLSGLGERVVRAWTVVANELAWNER